MQEMWVLSWGREVSLVKEMATHSSILAWEISWTEESGGRGMVHGVAESGMTEHTCAHTHTFFRFFSTTGYYKIVRIVSGLYNKKKFFL